MSVVEFGAVAHSSQAFLYCHRLLCLAGCHFPLNMVHRHPSLPILPHVLLPDSMLVAFIWQFVNLS